MFDEQTTAWPEDVPQTSVETQHETQCAPQYAVTVAAQAPAAPAAPQPAKRKPTGWAIFFLCLVSLGAMTFAEVIGYFIGLVTPLGIDLGTLAAGAIAGVLCIVALGGAKLLSPTRESWRTSWKCCWWFIAVSAVLMLFDTIGFAAEGSLVFDLGILMRFVETALLCFVIGLGEEVMVRGIVLGGLLAPLGSSKKGVWIAIFVSSLYFGLLHIDFTTTDFTDALQLAQAVLKVLQTGVYGFALACVAVGTDEIFSISILHAVDDFLLFIPSVVLAGESATAEYVYTDVEDAIFTIFMYAIMIALYLPVAIKAAKLVKDMPNPTRGAFWDARYGKEEAAAVVPAKANPAPVHAAPAPMHAAPAPAVPIQSAPTPAPATPVPAASAYADGLAKSSQNATAEDAATFSESTSFDMGMMTVSSDDSMTSSERP